MYNIEHLQNNQVKLINTNNNSYATIALNNGASILELFINNVAVIENLSPLKYTNTYASSILFPFANRIKDGSYTFNSKTYQLNTNQKEENNALHGLIYNKTFKVVNEKVANNEVSIKLEYNEINESEGFPFTYKIQLIYTLTKNTLKINVQVKNTHSKPFPFTIGWHPYFTSKNLPQSILKFNSTKKLILDKRMITTGIEDFKIDDCLEIKNNKFDDCFILNTNNIKFITPEYDLEMKASSNKTFLQIYTPERKNTIAIEPTTGVSDSFNNKIGLQVLEAGKTYNIRWDINLNFKI
jgi:aldose 1-epimerase